MWCSLRSHYPVQLALPLAGSGARSAARSLQALCRATRARKQASKQFGTWNMVSALILDPLRPAVPVFFTLAGVLRA